MLTQIMSVSPILPEVKKCVTFIFLRGNDGTFQPNGTGFFLSVKDTKNPELIHVYLATAKHVIQDRDENFYSSIIIRLNTKDGTSEFIELPLNRMQILAHKDPDVDAVVIPFLPDQQKFDFKVIHDDMITTKEMISTLEIGEGDEVFFSGLFTSHIGQKKNQPIIRFGKVALISDEKIEWQEKGKHPKSRDLYLLECQSFGGNSGSPVFFNLTPIRKPNQITIGAANQTYFAGIMTGSFLNANEVAIVDTKNLYSLQNVGIAAITPSYKVHELLFSEELIKQRLSAH
jgi:hypothetical protein